jgi:hypothetical protein
MKKLSTLLLFIISVSAFGQNIKRSYSSFYDRGNKTFGIELGVAGGYPINSVTELNISKEEKNYGLLLIPSYGWFVETNWVIGGQAILGFANESYNYSGFQFTSTHKANYADLGLAPFTRYYVPLGKRNVVSLFGQASMPVIYSSRKTEDIQTGSSPYKYEYSDYEIKLMGTLGLGVALNGRFGSLEVNANNTGLYVGFHKFIGKK